MKIFVLFGIILTAEAGLISSIENWINRRTLNYKIWSLERALRNDKSEKKKLANKSRMLRSGSERSSKKNALEKQMDELDRNMRKNKRLLDTLKVKRSRLP